MSLLATRDLTIRFGGHVAVNNVTCAFEPGTLTAIVGPNGAGKTTYFNLISGQLKASAGSVQLGGQDLTALSPSARTRAGLGRAFQLTNLFPNLSVLENVRLAVQATQGGPHRRGLNLWSIWSDHKGLLRRAEESYEFIWTYHHLITDGWSLANLFKEIFALYESACTGAPPRLSTPRPFGDYISWLQKQDRKSAEAFWRGYLKGFAAPTPLVVPSLPTLDGETAAPLHGEQSVLFPPALLAELRRLAHRERDGRVSARLLALANALEGLSREEAARLAGMTPQALTSVRGGRRLQLDLHRMREPDAPEPAAEAVPGGDGDEPPDEWLIVASERNDAALLDAMVQAFRLTAREAEVLYWVAKGKTNRDIGDILGAAPRTVTKHMEHILQKLGVETRTAAAAMVLARVRGFEGGRV